jgi:hypothetical protein
MTVMVGIIIFLAGFAFVLITRNILVKYRLGYVYKIFFGSIPAGLLAGGQSLMLSDFVGCANTYWWALVPIFTGIAITIVSTPPGWKPAERNNR